MTLRPWLCSLLLLAAGATTATADTLFTDPITVVDFNDFGTIRRAFGVAAGDFDGDGYPDLVASIVSGHVAFAKGNGDGTFQPKTVFAWKQTFFNGWAFAPGDLNGDGHLDVVWGATAASDPVGDGDVRVFYGNGDGTFQENAYFVSGVLHNAGVLVADVGDDAGSLAVGDVDGDLDDDIVVGSLDGANTTIKILINEGGGVFSSSTLFSHLASESAHPVIHFPAPGPFGDTRSKPWGLALSDADGDGDLDLWVGDRALYVYLFLNDGGSFSLLTGNTAVGGRPNVYLGHDTFRAAVGYTPALASGDLNGDGRGDLVVGLHSGTQTPASAVVNDGAILLDSSVAGGHAAATSLADVGTMARGVAVVDVNLDGLPDIVVGNYEGEVKLLLQILDTDGDGIPDGDDTCTDTDDDGYGDPGFPANTCDEDNCPANYNPDQADADADGPGDACDACPFDPDNDLDADDVCGDLDNCPATYNPDQADADADGLGDACDACPFDPDNDADDDGVCGDVDNCPDAANPAQLDVEGDGVGDACDTCVFVNDPDQDPGACSCPDEPDPASQGYWHRQCLGIPASEGGIDPGRNDGGPRGGLVELAFAGGMEFVTEWAALECAEAVLPNLFWFVEPELKICEALDADPPSAPCQRAQKQIGALLLNVCSGRTTEACEVDLAHLGCMSTTLGDLLFELADLVLDDNCKLAARCAEAINGGKETDEDPGDESELATAVSLESLVATDYERFGDLSEPNAPREQLRIVRALAARADPGHRLLLAEHVQYLRDKAIHEGDRELATEAERLLERIRALD